MSDDTLLALVPSRRSTAIILPETATTPQVDVSYHALRGLVLQFRDRLRQLRVSPQKVVAMSLVNGLEFVVGFLGTGSARYGHNYNHNFYSTSNVIYVGLSPLH